MTSPKCENSNLSVVSMEDNKRESLEAFIGDADISEVPFVPLLVGVVEAV